jgi:hypothetical protein
MPLAAVSTWITALGIPGLLALGGFVAWAIRSTIEDYRDAERELTAERRALYERVLEPFLAPLITADGQEDAVSAMQDEIFASPEYKRAVFEMTLFASDAVVRAFGDITNSANDPASNPLVLWARLLLAIRKSVGNKGSQLTLADMLRATIKDLDASPELLRALKEAK